MKKTIIKLFLGILVSFSVICCGNTAKMNQQKETEYGSTMKAYVMILNEHGLDSLCAVDTLPRNLDEWHTSSYNDYETNQVIVKRMYLKELTNEKEMIYIIIPKDEKYKVTKRQVTAN